MEIHVVKDIRLLKKQGRQVLLQRVIFMVVILAFSFSVSASQLYKADGNKYVVQPGDVLGISVWKETDLQLEIIVRPDGVFTLPLIGEVDARGQTIEDLRRETSRRFHHFIPDAEVSVFAKKLLGNKIFVIGKVNRPGEIILNSNIDVLQALSKAGGTTPFAEVDNIKILRRDGDSQHVFTFEYSTVEEGLEMEQNIILKSGDIVVVP